MKKELYLILISLSILLFSSCCTKKECSSVNPTFEFRFSGTDEEIQIISTNSFDIKSTESYSFKKDTTIVYEVPFENFEGWSFEIIHEGRRTVLGHFEVSVTGVTSIECNKCFLKQDDVLLNTYEITSYQEREKLVTTNYYEERF